MSQKFSKSALVSLLLLVSNVVAQPVPQAVSVMTDAQRDGIRRAITHTPYSALVVHTKVEIFPFPDKSRPVKPPDEMTEERHIYHARVLETFRGPAHASIRYQSIVDRGDSVEFSSKPQIVTLCKGSDGFYWPGSGASFDGDVEAVAEARRIGKIIALDKPKTFSDCQ